VRFPTCVEDVSRVMYDLSRKPSIVLAPAYANVDNPADHTKALPAITHFSAQNPYTKYEMTRLIAQYLGLPIEHVVPDTTDPATLPNQTVLRPGNTQLSVDELDALGISAGEEKGFETWWREWAQRHKA
jgi:S-adenosylmethionine synthetase